MGRLRILHQYLWLFTVKRKLRHIYVHVPFCSGKCSYCGFYSELFDKESATDFLNALKNEISVAGSEVSLIPHTIYIGGGTPLLLPEQMLRQLLECISDKVDLTELHEWTIEGNPDNLNQTKLNLLRQAGITRVSLGAQSMNDCVLQKAGRRHNAAATAAAASQLKRAGFSNFGLDLIAGLPGETTTSWRASLNAVINLTPAHVSVYALSIEPGSHLYQQHTRGLWQPPPHKQEAELLAVAEKTLAEAGYERYEISNYARPGFRCRHNCAVWQGADYIGFGPAAASRIGLTRRTNRPDLTGYCTRVPPPAEHDEVSHTIDAAERFMFALRLLDGINPAEYAARLGPAAQDLLPFWLKQLDDLHRQGLTEKAGNLVRLTKSGRNFADTVAAGLLPE